MIANLFQSLIDRGVEYVLISGRATVLYGAATFSEDIDPWIAFGYDRRRGVTTLTHGAAFNKCLS